MQTASPPMKATFPWFFQMAVTIGPATLPAARETARSAVDSAGIMTLGDPQLLLLNPDPMIPEPHKAPQPPITSAAAAPEGDGSTSSPRNDLSGAVELRAGGRAADDRRGIGAQPVVSSGSVLAGEHHVPAAEHRSTGVIAGSLECRGSRGGRHWDRGRPGQYQAADRETACRLLPIPCTTQ